MTSNMSIMGKSKAAKQELARFLEPRIGKVQRYLRKKYSKKKNSGYDCRVTIAKKRLRVEGRFVTKAKAFEMLGLTQEDLLTNDTIQTLLNKREADKQLTSLIQSDKRGGHIVKVHNFQALIDDNWKAENNNNEGSSKPGVSRQNSMTSPTILDKKQNHLVNLHLG